jgi:hypothetical protein
MALPVSALHFRKTRVVSSYMKATGTGDGSFEGGRGNLPMLFRVLRADDDEFVIEDSMLVFEVAIGLLAHRNVHLLKTIEVSPEEVLQVTP